MVLVVVRIVVVVAVINNNNNIPAFDDLSREQERGERKDKNVLGGSGMVGASRCVEKGRERP